MAAAGGGAAAAVGCAQKPLHAIPIGPACNCDLHKAAPALQRRRALACRSRPPCSRARPPRCSLASCKRCKGHRSASGVCWRPPQASAAASPALAAPAAGSPRQGSRHPRAGSRRRCRTESPPGAPPAPRPSLQGRRCGPQTALDIVSTVGEALRLPRDCRNRPMNQGPPPRCRHGGPGGCSIANSFCWPAGVSKLGLRSTPHQGAMTTSQGSEFL